MSDEFFSEGIEYTVVTIEISDLIGKAIERIEKLYTDKQAYTGIPSGFNSLDQMTSGFQPSEMIIISARSSMDKTAMALSMLQHISVEKRIPAAFFSLEVSNMQIMQRLLSQESRISFERLRTGFLKQDDFPHLLHAADRLYQAPIFIVESFNIKLHDLLATARRLRAQNKIEIIFIDDITYIQSENTFITRHEQITEISRSLKNLARELEIPIVVLSQLRCDAEQKEPTFADIREFDSIGQYADVVMFIHREQKIDKIEDASLPMEAKLILAKQRNGPVGFVEVRFISSYMKFESKSRMSDENFSEGNFKCTITDEQASITKYSGSDKTLIIPKTLGGYEVTSIGNRAFQNCTSLTTIEIPDSVTSIGNSAFSSCTSLTSIEIPNSVNSIGDRAFASCSSLSSTVISDSVTSIGEGAFDCCTSLTGIAVPDSVTSIGNGTFQGCTSLTCIEIPDPVTRIGDRAFYKCARLTTIEISDPVTSIGDRAFYGCTSLTTVFYQNKELKTKCVDGDFMVVKSVHEIDGFSILNCLYFGTNRKCFVAEKNGILAHGKTIKQAIDDNDYIQRSAICL